MRVLHLYANHKWTGPADLAMVLARAQVGCSLPDGGLSRSDSIEPSLALAGHVHRGMQHAIDARARELELPTRKGLLLRKHFHLPSLFKDARQLAAWIDDGSVDLLHTHQPADHLTAALSLGLSRRRVPLVRSFWEDRVPLPTPRQAFAFARSSAVVVSYPSQTSLFQSRFGLRADRIRQLDPVLDTRPAENGGPDRASARSSLRHELGLEQSAFLVGITARIQRNRRWDLHWKLLAELAPSLDKLHFVVLGRPDEGVFDELCTEPLERLGLGDRVHFLGYRMGEAYWSALASLDAFLFLVPGTDASCRALREAMLLGVPVLCSDMGRLPEIVSDGEDGLVRPAKRTMLAAALSELIRDGELRDRLGARARVKARERWSGELQMRGTLDLYARVLERPS